MNNTLKHLAFLAVVTFLMQSCVSNKSFQTARTTAVGDYGWGFGVSLPKGEYIDTSAANTVLDTIDTGGFAGEIFGRFGVAEKVDIGINLTLIGTGGADVKYQFLGDSESTIAGAVGLGVGYLSIGASENNSDDGSYTVLDFAVPTYFSYHPAEMIGVYASPKFIYRKFGNDNTTFFGGVAGLRIGGERGAAFIEYGYLTGGSDIFSNQTQFNIGFGIGIQ